MVGELVIAQSILAEDPALTRSTDERLGRRLAQLKRITGDLQRNAMSMRMVPIRQTFQKMARLVRDLSKKSGKHDRAGAAGRGHRARSQGGRGHRRSADAHGPQQRRPRHRVAERARRRRQAGAGDAAPERLPRRAATSSSRSPTTAPGSNTERIRAKAIANGLIADGTQLAPADDPPADLPARLLDRREGHRDLRPRRRHGRRAPQHRGAARPHRDPDRRAARARRSRSGCR